jgi:hypothetical protein
MDAHIQRKEGVKIWIPVPLCSGPWGRSRQRVEERGFIPIVNDGWMDGFVCGMRFPVDAQAFDATSSTRLVVALARALRQQPIGRLAIGGS